MYTFILQMCELRLENNILGQNLVGKKTKEINFLFIFRYVSRIVEYMFGNYGLPFFIAYIYIN